MPSHVQFNLPQWQREEDDAAELIHIPLVSSRPSPVGFKFPPIEPHPMIAHRWRKIQKLVKGFVLFVLSVAIVVMLYVRYAGHPTAVVMDPALDDIVLPIDRVTALWKDDFQCLGWRAVAGCDPTGKRQPSEDRACDEPITRDMAGYCEVRNRTSGEIHRVMATTCRGLHQESAFTCNMAKNFTDFSILAASYQHTPPLQVSSSPKISRGIAMSIYQEALPSVFAIVRTLRLHKCKLPIELFYRPSEVSLSNPIVTELISHYNCRLREIRDPLAVRFKTKPYAIYHSQFDHVLFLDSDNIPAKDPTYLFSSPEFIDHGAIFWPDFWQAPYSLFNVNKQSLLWQLVDMPFWNTFEQESGQLLIDRRRSHDALHKLMFYSVGDIVVGDLLEQMRLVWGDKDLFRLAWQNTSTPYYFVQQPPGLGGLYDESSRFFCGVAMIQYDPQGEILFVHRNTVKMTGSPSQTQLITHLQQFTYNDDNTHMYEVSLKGNRMGQKSCYFLPDGVPNSVEGLEKTSISKVEETALQYAIEAGKLIGFEDTKYWGSTLELLELVALYAFGVFALCFILNFAFFRFYYVEKKLYWFDRYSGKKRKYSTPILHLGLMGSRRRSRSMRMGLSIKPLYGLLGLVLLLSVVFGLRDKSIADEVVMNPKLNTLSVRVDRVRDVWTDESFQCIAWRATNDCNPNGPRLPAKDKSCDALIGHKMAGYCEIRNRTSGEIFHVMATTCKSVDDDVTFSCNMARDFTDFSILAAQYKRPPHIAFDLPVNAPKNGIVMSIYDKVLPSAYAVVRTLRLLGCKLAVEIWYRREQINPMNPMIQELVAHHNCYLREIFEPSATHFHTKPYAIYYSAFENVLFLDSDNIPAKDPTYLFESKEFQSTGAIFWPDFWHPNNTLFNVHQQSLLWQILDMPFVDMFEQESGQILINKTKSQAALNKLMYYSGHVPRLLDQLELVWGDKDLYRLAWQNTSTPYYMESRPPSLGGLYDPTSQYFCGVAMLQYDMHGELLFFHRNTVKLTGSPHQTPVITHVQTFTGAGSHRVDIQGNRMGQSSCFFLTESSFVTPIQDTKHATLEETAIQFSIQGSAMAPRPKYSIWSSVIFFAHKMHVTSLVIVGLVIVLGVFCFANIAMVRLTTRRFWIQHVAGVKRKNSIPVV
ncbi:hypothetical protein THRCLA_03598 [Thraustotheca clavata]|uniref:Nucleotide-diphospho-sugar transferase n=1 Tax=Thraustotheca clavata TaxID=74557 RepID=A0A1W0A1I3_9STRA|nr:hypothetical protein THRCLA_03598 [Thraustotheca clavata]